ncbi:carbonic anhydrase, partial [Micromonospora carbonacea]|uniref:carbonic anhydrase n=1 Tax=Micromonospora carbonacea TaxID=47853 RepID=UPI0033E53945
TVGPEVLGSVEYAVTVLGTPLVVVLGHDSCGMAVRTALWRVVVATTPPGGTGRPAVRRGRARCGADDHALP